MIVTTATTPNPAQLSRRPAARVQNSEKDLFGPGPPPEAPKEPKKPFMMKVEKTASGLGWVIGGVAAGAVGWGGAQAAGGVLGRTLGVGAGLGLIPVGAGAVGLAGLLVGSIYDAVTDNYYDSGKEVLGIGGLVVGGLAAPIAGWFLGGTSVGGWKAGLLAAGAAIGGVITGGILGENFEYGPASRGYEDALYEYRDKMELHEKEMAEYQRAKIEYSARQAKDGDIDIEQGEDFIVVGDIDLDVKN